MYTRLPRSAREGTNAWPSNPGFPRSPKTSFGRAPGSDPSRAPPRPFIHLRPTPLFAPAVVHQLDGGVCDPEHGRASRIGRPTVGRNRMSYRIGDDDVPAQRSAPQLSAFTIAQHLRLFEISGCPLLISLRACANRRERE